jgi:hypothetical protein
MSKRESQEREREEREGTDSDLGRWLGSSRGSGSSSGGRSSLAILDNGSL